MLDDDISLNEVLVSDSPTPSQRKPDEIMKAAIIKGNKNISLTTMGLKRRPKLQTTKHLTLSPLPLSKKPSLKQIHIWHVESNQVQDTIVNKAIRTSNELIRIANLSYYH